MMIKNFLFYAFSTMMNSWAATAGPGMVFRTWGIVSICLLATTIPMCKFNYSLPEYSPECGVGRGR